VKLNRRQVVAYSLAGVPLRAMYDRQYGYGFDAAGQLNEAKQRLG